MGLVRKFLNQTRKPEGILGKVMLGGMNSGHAAMADWGMGRLPEIHPRRIIDIGCGGGRNARVLLEKYPQAVLTAVDHSPLSVEKTVECNQEFVLQGRCTVLQGDVGRLPCVSESFDLATAFETIYFWPGLKQCFAQVARVLQPGGLLLIVNESDGMDKAGRKYGKIIEGMTLYTAGQIEAALHGAGFSIVKTEHHPSRPWIAVRATKAD